MNKADTGKVIARLKSLWPRWTANTDQEAIWADILLPYGLGAALACVERFYKIKGGQRIEPPLPDFLDLLKDWQTDSPQRGIPKKLSYICFICERLDENGKGHIGDMETYEWLAKLNENGEWMVPSQDYLHRHCQDYTHRRGGHWIAYVSPNDLDAKNKARQILHDAKLCNPQTCFICLHKAGTCRQFCYQCYLDRIKNGSPASIKTILAKCEQKRGKEPTEDRGVLGSIITQGLQKTVINQDAFNPNSLMKGDLIPF